MKASPVADAMPFSPATTHPQRFARLRSKHGMIDGGGTVPNECVSPLIRFVERAPNQTANHVSANLSCERERPFGR